MIIAGIMSGTSADGIDVAVVELRGRSRQTRPKLLVHRHFPYPKNVRLAVLQVMNGAAPVAELARLNFLLGELYADAVLRTQHSSGLKCELIGCHGQTLYHQGEPQNYLGHQLSVTWQMGESAVIAALCGVPVVADFRPADMAAGGKGAPLVPFLDYLWFRHPRRGRLVQNLGGIANLTAIPPAASPDQVIAFDTGPANMVMDALVEKLFGFSCDKNGSIAARGKPLENVVSECLRLPFFRQKPPRTAGREEFGREFVGEFLRKCKRAGKEDVLATATLLTARSIGMGVQLAIEQCAGPKEQRTRFHDFFVSGGGVRNRTLMCMIEAELALYSLAVHTSDESGLPSQAKEAVAFAVLAYQTWLRRTGNLPSATGAKSPAILGKIAFPWQLSLKPKTIAPRS